MNINLHRVRRNCVINGPWVKRSCGANGLGAVGARVLPQPGVK